MGNALVNVPLSRIPGAKIEKPLGNGSASGAASRDLLFGFVSTFVTDGAQCFRWEVREVGMATQTTQLTNTQLTHHTVNPRGAGV